MDDRIKWLIAIGASLTANCQPCLQYHVGKALESGATELEISEAIEVAKTVRKGAGSKMDKFAAQIFNSAAIAVNTSEQGCACG
jgi:AhpD family alkylhydroperoxidase